MRDDELLDQAIDEVARELTMGAPRPGFAGRVRERVEAPSLQTRWPWLLAGATLAAALIVWLSLPGRPGVPSQVPSHQLADRALPPVPDRETTAKAASATEQRQPQRAARRTLPGLRIPVKPEAPAQIAPLAEIAELDVAVQGPEVFTVAALEIPDLHVPPVTPDFKEPR